MVRLSWVLVAVAVSACGSRAGLKSGGTAGTGIAGASGSADGAAGDGAAGTGAAGTAGAADARLDTGPAATDVSGPAPAPFMLTSPVSKPDEQDAPILTWEAPEGAVTFDVEISTTETFTDATTQRMSGLTKPTSFLPAPIAPAVVYFWRVTAVGAGGARTVATNAPAWFAKPFTGAKVPYALALTPTGKLLVVDRSPPVGLVMLDLGTSKVRTVLTGGAEGRGVAVTADGKRAYVSEIGSYRVSEIDVEGDAPAKIVPATIGKLIYGLAVTPDGSTLVAPVMDDALREDVLELIPLRDGVMARSIRLGVQQIPYTVVLTPDGASALVNTGGLLKVDLASGNITKIPRSGGDSVAVTGDGRTAWATAYTAGVIESDLTTNTPGRAIPFIGTTDLCGLAVSPDGTRAVATAYMQLGVLDLTAAKVERTYPIRSRCAVISADSKRAYVSTSGAPSAVIVLKLP